MLRCSVWLSIHEILGIGYIFGCKGVMFYGSAEELSGLNLGSGSFKPDEEISKQGSVSAK